MKTFARSLLRDLIEKRLWPVAAALVIALFAIPFVVGRGSEPAPAPTPTPATTDAGGADQSTKAQVSLAQDPSETRKRAGTVRNPFKTTKTAAAATPETPSPSTGAASPMSGTASTGSGATPGSSGGSGSTDGSVPSAGFGSTGSGSTGSGSTGSGSTTTTPKTPATPTAVDSSDTFHVTLRFGQTGKQRTIRDIARLTPLPSLTSPFFVFLGVLEDGKTAVFMLSSDTAPTGDGTCRPAADACETIELKAGDTEFFDVKTPRGAVLQYQIDLSSIRKTKVNAAAKAAKAYARHSKSGSELLRSAAVRGPKASAGARSYRYLPESGVLVRAKRATRPRASAGALVPGAAEAVSLVPGTQQPGVAVWNWDAGKPGR
jgi:hypothetical protein